MKNVLIRLSLICLIAGSCTIADAQTQDLTPYHHQEYNFSISLPAGWEIQEGFMGSAVMALSPAEGPADDFRENINVYVEPLDPGIDLNTYLTGNLQMMQKLLTDFQSLGSENITVNGLEGRTLIYTHRMGQIRIKVLAALFVRNGNGYSVTCSAMPETFDDYRPSFNQIIDSFMIK